MPKSVEDILANAENLSKRIKEKTPPFCCRKGVEIYTRIPDNPPFFNGYQLSIPAIALLRPASPSLLQRQ